MQCYGGIFDWDKAIKRLHFLNAQAEDPALWNDSAKASLLMQERQKLEQATQDILAIEQDLAHQLEFLALAEAENDLAMVAESENAIKALKHILDKKKLMLLLAGEADGNDAYLEIHAGAGGTESQDWAEMLLRMYTRWGEKSGKQVDLLEIHNGEEAGIKSATILIKGENAYGLLRSESGVHRLVRISPFDANARRHTSFASVWVYPVIADDVEVNVSENEVRIDTYRASGAGGQHVNTTDSAVRITHLATGIVVQCQSERSQHRNKAAAWAMLRSRLYERELEKREQEANQLQATKTDIGWGNQIRSYVLQPYQLVKDLRTGVENTNPEEVLSGDINGFIEASLALRAPKE